MDTLFGENFQISLTKTVEKETALAKAAKITKGKTLSPTSYRNHDYSQEDITDAGINGGCPPSDTLSPASLQTVGEILVC